MIFTGIITVGNFSSSGAFDSSAGPAVRAAVAERGWHTIAEAIVPDDFDQIARTVLDFARLGCRLILTAGGIGISRHDVVPEAIRSIARIEIPGFGESMRRQSSATAPTAVLSRGFGSVVENSLVVSLPENPQGAVECLDFVTGVIPPTVQLLQRENAGGFSKTSA